MGTTGKTVALVVAAGSGSRAGGEVPKQYRKIGGKSLLAHAMEHLRHPRIDEIRVVIGPGQEALYADALGDRALPHPVLGGETRQQSVRNGLEAVATAGGADIVLIHDAARPFVPAAVIGRLLDAMTDHQGAVPGLPVVDTLVRNGEAVPRDDLYRVQTPQAFRFEVALAAHRQSGSEAEATDDAQLVRDRGHDVVLIPGDPLLEKLTHPADFERAERQLAAELVSCTGFGFDVHAFAAGEQLWLGGILIPHTRGLSGHSDADVALHALTDAILGAIGAGDIGEHFPPSDPQWRCAASSRFVEHARALVEERGGRIDHVDVTIICEAPRIGPHKPAIRERIAGLLRLPFERVSIKATTTERLGFAGRGEGIAAQAIATVRLPEQI